MCILDLNPPNNFLRTRWVLNLLDSHLGKYKFTLERLSLAFTSPNTQNERNLNCIQEGWQVRTERQTRTYRVSNIEPYF